MSEYRPTKEARDEAFARLQNLRKTEAQRRRDRRRRGYAEADQHLERAEADFKKLDSKYQALGNQLAEAIYRVAQEYAKRYKPLQHCGPYDEDACGYDLDDFIQQGTVYAASRIHCFDPTKGTSLFSFVTQCVYNAWLPMLRKESTHAARFTKYAADKSDEFYNSLNQKDDAEEFAGEDLVCLFSASDFDDDYVAEVSAA